MRTLDRVGETTIPGKNQITLPAESVRQLGWEKGDRLIVHVIDNGTLMLMRKPERWSGQYAGLMGDVFGDHEDILAYLDGERRSWDPDNDAELEAARD